MRLMLAVAFVLLANPANADCKQIVCYSLLSTDFVNCKNRTAPKSTGAADFFKINLIIKDFFLNKDCSIKIIDDGDDAKNLAIKQINLPLCMYFRGEKKGSLVSVVVTRSKEGGDWSLYCPPINF